MSAYGDMDQAVAGLKFGLDSRVESWAVQDEEGIPFGLAVFGYQGDGNKAYRYHNDRATMVFDADFVASNSIVLTITVDGVADALSPVVFATDQATTMGLLITALTAAGYTAQRTDIAGDDRTIELIVKGEDPLFEEAVTGGASQPTGTVTYDSSQVLAGISLFVQKEPSAAETALWEQYESMNVLTSGWVFAEVVAAVSSLSGGFIVTTSTPGGAAGADAGKFGPTATRRLATQFRFRDDPSAAGLVLVEVVPNKSFTVVS